MSQIINIDYLSELHNRFNQVSAWDVLTNLWERDHKVKAVAVAFLAAFASAFGLPITTPFIFRAVVLTMEEGPDELERVKGTIALALRKVRPKEDVSVIKEGEWTLMAIRDNWHHTYIFKGGGKGFIYFVYENDKVENLKYYGAYPKDFPKMLRAFVRLLPKCLD